MPGVASLFNLAGPDLVIILVIVLLLFGAKQLPELGRRMGEAVQESSNSQRELFDLDFILLVLAILVAAMLIFSSR